MNLLLSRNSTITKEREWRGCIMKTCRSQKIVLQVFSVIIWALLLKGAYGLFVRPELFRFHNIDTTSIVLSAIRFYEISHGNIFYSVSFQSETNTYAQSSCRRSMIDADVCFCFL